jgi:hypothetical protein
LRLHGDRFAAAPQLAALDIKGMIIKQKLHVAPRIVSQGKIKPVSSSNQAAGKVFRPRFRHPGSCCDLDYCPPEATI